MPLQPGLLYEPYDVAFDTTGNAVYVVEQFNHRVSKWVYAEGFFVFSLADGNVTGLTLVAGGTSGYSTALLVIEGPTGTAQADATVTTGAVTNIAITNGGSGYTTAPNVAIISVEGANATAIANISNGSVIGISITNGGTGYITGTQITPLVVIDAPEGKSRATGTAAANGTSITSVTLTFNGNGYETTPTVSIVSDSPNSGTASVTAVANITSWGNNGDGTTGQAGTPTSLTDNFLYRPSGIAFDSTRLYLTDSFNNRLRVINPTDGSFTTSVGQGGTGDTDFYRPTGIAVNDANTFLVIADEFNRKAKRYSAIATPAFQDVLPEPTPKSFVKPHGVSFEVDQNKFVVTDSFRNVLSQYNNIGTNFELQRGKASGGDADDDLYFPGSGTGENAADADLIFPSTRKNSLKQFDAFGGTIANFLTNVTGTDDGQLYWPESSAAFEDNVQYLLVANTRNHRVEVFDQAKVFKNNFGR